jgi:hypothetical protein
MQLMNDLYCRTKTSRSAVNTCHRSIPDCLCVCSKASHKKGLRELKEMLDKASVIFVCQASSTGSQPCGVLSKMK